VKTRVRRIAAFAAAILFWMSPAVRAQEPQPLVTGLNVERTLGLGEKHIYTITLQEGAAVIGAADQHGVDLVIDIFDPDGKKVATVDTPNGAEGPEPIDLTAFKTGPYRLVLHPKGDPKAKPGKYVMKVYQILTPVENAKRLAKDLYPTKVLYDLWEASVSDPKAADTFISDRKRKGPIIEAIPVNPSEMQVTYLYLGNQDTQSVELVGGPDLMGLKMSRLGQTDLFFVIQVVANDARFIYAFNAYEMHRAGSKGEVEVTKNIHSDDSLLEMQNAPSQLYIAAKDVTKGTAVQTTIKSTLLNEERKITVYTPAGCDGKTGCSLLVVFDGGAYGGLPDPALAEVPTPTILDNLIADKKIAPTVAVLVWSMGKRNRDLPGSKPFADLIANEVVPWARSHYSISPGPNRVVAAGSSLGGYCAAYCAFTQPDAIGNVISQSGSYWISKNWQTVDANFDRRVYPRETGTMIEEFKNSKRLPIRFYMEVGVYDLGAAMLGSNRELRDVLQLKGYDVDYHEFDGGHNSLNWRGSLADGLIALLAP
jgi:enterochelin esterase-like enzyme